MVGLHLLLFASAVLFLCRCCYNKLNMSCRKITDNLSAINPFRYYGLVNRGATCYLNSVLQVLFMTEDFREAVNSSSKSEFIDHHLKDLFKQLLTQTSDTSRIIQALGIEKVYEQQDAAEFCQKILRMTSPEAAKIFHGEMTERISCLSCHKQVETNVPFWLLPLPLVDSRGVVSVVSVVGSIKNFFQRSFFSGENQMYCEKCDKKSDASGMSVVKHYPDVLILLLKRFVFSYDSMSYVKISCTVEVPFSLNISENQTYELYAIIDHFGDLRSGHYSSRIQSQLDSGWHQFSDNSVTALGCCKLSEKGDTEKSKSAYLLFYRKKDTENTPMADGELPFAASEDPGAEKPAHNANEGNLLLPEVSLKAQNQVKNEPAGLDEMDISDNYTFKPEPNYKVCKTDGLRRTDEENEKLQTENLEQHSQSDVDEGFRNMNRAEHLRIRQNQGKDAAKPADFDGIVSDKQMKTDVENEGDKGIKDSRIAETRNAPEVQDRQFTEGDERRERSNSGALYLDPLQEEEEERAQEDEDLRITQKITAFKAKPVEPQNKRKLPDDLNTPEQETCVKRKTQNENNPSVNQENGKQPGLQQSGKAENQTDDRLEKSDGGPSPKHVKVLVLEEEERDRFIGDKKIIVKVIEETLYSNMETYHEHNE